MSRYAAYLRVYQPLAALPVEERDRWAEYAAGGRAPARAQGAAREHAAGIAALVAEPPRLSAVDQVDEAFVLTRGGQLYVCPWRTQLRSWEALAEFRRGLPEELADAFVPATVAEAAEQARQRWLAAHPQARPAILTSTWQVPVPWFVLFEPAEREIVVSLPDRPGRGPGAAGGRSLVYRTAMVRARQRVARALQVLRRAFPDGPAVGGLEELGRWLEEFHPHSFVELDYGGLVSLLREEELVSDRSVQEVAEALGCLARGQRAAALASYERVTGRWRRLAMLENAN